MKRMSAAQIPAFHLRSRDGTAEESIVLAGIWRRAWISANRNAAFTEPISHWLKRVQTEFVPPAEVVLAERDGQVLAFMVLLERREYVAQLFVEPHLRNQGLGQALLDEACVRIPRAGGSTWPPPTPPRSASTNATASCAARSTGIRPADANASPTIGRPRARHGGLAERPSPSSCVMRIDHIALWTTDLERCKRFYVDYFGATAGAGYVNPAKGFASCFLSLGDGARIEAMTTSTLSPVPPKPARSAWAGRTWPSAWAPTPRSTRSRSA
jgi:putative acetyltransferase